MHQSVYNESIADKELMCYNSRYSKIVVNIEIMKMNRRTKYKLYPSETQKEALFEMLKMHQQLYNAALEQRIWLLNREILATSPATFIHMLKYKAEEAGIAYIEVPTLKIKPSQTCSSCGHQQKKLLSEREHICECGSRLTRDQNAALVCLNYGLKNVTGQKLPEAGNSAEIPLNKRD